MAMEQWVVTYRIEQKNHNWGIAEFFRGSEEECKRIGRAFAGGSSDIIPTEPWGVLVGRAEDWDYFLSEQSQEEEL